MTDLYAAYWVAVCLPRLPLEAFTRGRIAPDGDGHPLAVCDAREVLMADPVAQAAGVLPGTRRATALALCPSLRLLQRDPAREQNALEQAACWALQFTPSVSLQSPPAHACMHPSTSGPAGLLLEVAPSLRLFGGRQALAARLRAGLTELGFSASIAGAPNPGGAWLLALDGKPLLIEDDARLRARLASLPLERLAAARPHREALAAIGVRTLRELLQLPRAGLARRFGKDLLEALDLALGQRPEPRTWFIAPPRFDARLELLTGVEHAQALLFAAQRLLTQLAGWLSARHAATRAVDLLGEHETAPHSTFTMRFAEPVRDADRMLGVLRESLATRALRAPVHALVLRTEDATPLPQASATLFPLPGDEQEHLGRLVERLQARLGPTQVQRLLVAHDHRPEAAFRVMPFEMGAEPPTQRRASVCATDTQDRPTLTTGGLPRPLWLLARPLAIGERSERPFWNGPLSLLTGPERIESGWWDGQAVQRDYFIAADASGALLWLYRERRPDPDGRGGWFIHGRFG